MRASAARIMATIRADYELSVRDAWQAYREFRDSIEGKPSLAALRRNERNVNDIVDSIKHGPLPEDYPEDFDYDYDYEVTAAYEG